MADWIIPCNPGVYDLFGAFTSLETVDWRQSAKSIETGDHVFIYVSSPVQAVAYRCKVMETMIPSESVDRSDDVFNVSGSQEEDDDHIYMRLKPDCRIPLDKITFQKMRNAGLKGCIQGQRRVPEELRGLFE